MTDYYNNLMTFVNGLDPLIVSLAVAAAVGLVIAVNFNRRITHNKLAASFGCHLGRAAIEAVHELNVELREKGVID